MLWYGFQIIKAALHSKIEIYTLVELYRVHIWYKHSVFKVYMQCTFRMKKVFIDCRLSIKTTVFVLHKAHI